MNNISDIKIALVAGSTNWMPQELVSEQRHILFEKYKDKYGSDFLYECPVVINDNEINIKRVLKDIGNNECNALCVYFANYGPESAASLLVDKFNGPVMFFAASEEDDEPLAKNRKDALSGFINALYALKLKGRRVYIPTKPVLCVKDAIEDINKFISIARAIISIKNLKIISFGPRPSTYLASVAPVTTLYNIGVDISEFSELELFNSYEKHVDDKRIEQIANEMKLECNVNDEIINNLKKYAQYQITIEDWVRNFKGDRKFVALTSTCWPAFPVNFGFTPCYVNSRLTSKGIPVACEVDVYGALSEYIGQAISNDKVTILNINNNISYKIYENKIKSIDFNGYKYKITDLFLGYHCGVTCSDKLKNCKLENHFINNQLIGSEKSHGTIQGRLKEEFITIFRLQGYKNNSLKAYIAEGQILPVDIDTYGGYAVIAIKEMERFIRNVIIEESFPNHTIVIYGKYGKEIFDTLRYLGINDIFYNHDANHFYIKENIFDNGGYYVE